MCVCVAAPASAITWPKPVKHQLPPPPVLSFLPPLGIHLPLQLRQCLMHLILPVKNQLELGVERGGALLQVGGGLV
eukprot:scaffold33459_cov79-Isochrysis_galbana.AAC.1